MAVMALGLCQRGGDRTSRHAEVLVDQKRKSSQRVGRPKGRYANYFEVGHNAFEFVLDFGQFYSESKQAQLHTRIITGPAYAKALLETLRRSIDRYEQTPNH